MITKLYIIDSNGKVLPSEDSVVLIKDVHVKGMRTIAKRGTALRRISVDHDNAEYRRQNRWNTNCNYHEIH